MPETRTTLAPSLTPHEFAEAEGVRYRTVLAWINRGLIDCYRLPGGTIRIPSSELERIRSGGGLA
jgi:excisionase family DNA binding protein